VEPLYLIRGISFQTLFRPNLSTFNLCPSHILTLICPIAVAIRYHTSGILSLIQSLQSQSMFMAGLHVSNRWLVIQRWKSCAVQAWLYPRFYPDQVKVCALGVRPLTDSYACPIVVETQFHTSATSFLIQSLLNPSMSVRSRLDIFWHFQSGGAPVPYKRDLIPDSIPTKSKYVVLSLRTLVLSMLILCASGGNPVPYKRRLGCVYLPLPEDANWFNSQYQWSGYGSVSFGYNPSKR